MSASEMEKRPPTALSLPASNKESSRQHGPSPSSGGGKRSGKTGAPSGALATARAAGRQATPRGQQKTADARGELGSAFRPGPRKGGARLDLAFDDAPPSRQRHSAFARGGRRQSEAFSKEQYLKANCQFVVSAGVDLGLYTRDPDVSVDWAAVEELRIWGGDEAAACPICLYPPAAGKMGRCGHIFCWPCVLHYLALSDRAWRKCPICYEPIYPKELRSFCERRGSAVSVNASLSLHLMCRVKGSVEALPATHAALDEEDSVARFAKIVGLPDAEIVERILGRERRELDFLLATEAGTPEICFVHQALEELEKRQELIAIRQSAAALLPALGDGNASGVLSTLAGGVGFDDAKTTVFVDAFYELENLAIGVTEPKVAKTDDEGPSCTAIPEEAPASPTKASSHAYFFYQASDGQCVFLHPVTAKMVAAQFGSLEAGPAVLEGRVLELESVVIGEQFRQRFRYLGHLPLGSTVVLAELALPANLISKDVRAQFAVELNRRAGIRRHRASDEKRRAAKAAEWDRALLMQAASSADVAAYVSGSGGQPPDIPTVTYVASAQHEPPRPRPPTPPPFDLQADFGLLEAAPPTDVPRTAAVASSSPPGLSFAQMLRSAGPKTTGAWGAPPPPSPATKPNDQDEGETSHSAPNYGNTFGDAFASALDQAALRHKNEASATTGKKKKKTKGTLLFSM